MNYVRLFWSVVATMLLLTLISCGGNGGSTAQTSSTSGYSGTTSGFGFASDSGTPSTNDPPAQTDFSGTWVGSYSCSPGMKYPVTLYFKQNKDGTAKGYMASNKYSGDFEYCKASGMNISCIVRSMDWKNSANLWITRTSDGLKINSFTTGSIIGSEVYSGTGSATYFDSSTETGLRGVWTGTATGPDGQSNQNAVVMVVADNVAGGSTRYVGGVFTTIKYASGDFVMNAEPWQFSINGYDLWYGQGLLATTGNPVSTLNFSIANNINYQPVNTYTISLNRIPQ